MKSWFKLLLIYILVVFTAGSGFYLTLNHFKNSYLKQRTATQQTAYDGVLNSHRLLADTYFHEIINQPEILEQVQRVVHSDGEEQQKQRGLLYRALAPVYRRNKTNIAEILHFHFPDNRSLLRFHLPSVSGDDLTELRPSVHLCNSLLQAVHGFEDGRVAQGYRHVYPLIYQREHIGSVEISHPYHLLYKQVQKLETATETQYVFFQNKTRITKKLFLSEVSSFVAGELAPQFIRQKQISQLLTRSEEIEPLSPETLAVVERLKRDRYTQQNLSQMVSFSEYVKANATVYSIVFYPLTNVSGQTEGYLLGIAPEPQIHTLTIRFVLAFLIFAIILLGIFIYRGTLQTALIEKKKTKKALQAFFDNKLVGMVQLDAEGHYTQVNQQWEKMTGYSQGELLQMNFRQLTHPDDVGKNSIFDRLSRGGDKTTLQIKKRYMRKDGQFFWANLSGSGIYDELNQFTGLVAMIRDISLERKAEDSLKKSEEKHRLLYEYAPFPYQSLDADGRIIDINTDWMKTFGYSVDEVIGQWYGDFLADEDQKVFADNFPLLKSGGYVHDVPFRIRHKKGHYLDILLEGRSGYTPEGDFTQTYCLLQDVSEKKRAEEKLKESERKFRLLADFTQDWEYWINPQGQYIYISPSCERISGYHPDEFMSNPNLLFEITTADYGTKIHQHYNDETFSCAEDFLLEFQITAKNGEVRWLEHNCIPIFDEDGNFAGRRGNNRDITQKKRGEAYLQSIFRSAPVGIGLVVERKLKKVNKKFEDMLDYTWAELEGKSSRMLYPTEKEFEWVGKEKYQQIAKYGTGTVETKFMKKDGSIIDVLVSSTPLDLNDRSAGVVFTALDISKQKLQTRILRATIELRQYSDHHSVGEILQRALDNAEKITGSRIGFFHFIAVDEKTISLQAWSTNTLENTCQTLGSETHYPVSEAGVWVDCVRQKKTVIHNDYLSLPDRKGLPDGHAPVIRELVVPIFRDNKIVAILGVGNKTSNYTQKDVRAVEEWADVVWEIVQRKQAEDAKRQSDEKFSRIFKLSPDAIGLSRLSDGVFIEVNPGFTGFLGWTAEETVGRSSVELKLWNGSEDRENVVSRLLEGSDIDDIEMPLRHKDGRILMGLVSTRLLTVDGERCMLNVVRDLTERKKTENAIIKAKDEWEATFNAMTDMVTIHDKDMIIHRANKAAHDLLGADYGSLNGKKCCEILWGAAETCSGCPLLTTVTTGRQCSEIIDHNLSKKTMLVTTVPIPVENGQPEYFIHVARDISEQQQLEKQANRANRLASLGELAAGIAHEINNPNALILYNSDILNTMIMDLFRFLEENPPADSGQLFGGLSYQDVAREVPVLLPMIQDSAQRIKRIVNDLRDFSRQDSSAPEDIVDVNQAVQASVRLVHNAIKKATDHFAMDLAAALPVVMGATGRLDQVIINLLMNACQALENRAQAVSISTAYDTETGQVQVIVADEGHGMTDDVVEHILEPFVTTKREQGGTGLGLSVSSRIIRELQGTLRFTSAPGEGTTATISLPVRKEVNHDG